MEGNVYLIDINVNYGVKQMKGFKCFLFHNMILSLTYINDGFSQSHNLRFDLFHKQHNFLIPFDEATFWSCRKIALVYVVW